MENNNRVKKDRFTIYGSIVVAGMVCGLIGATIYDNHKKMEETRARDKQIVLDSYYITVYPEIMPPPHLAALEETLFDHNIEYNKVKSPVTDRIVSVRIYLRSERDWDRAFLANRALMRMAKHMTNNDPNAISNRFDRFLDFHSGERTKTTYPKEVKKSLLPEGE